ncbi:MAG TPA: CpsD/CapB family tyrosine-protein kinase, partial [Verrucomicrobiae bacterium]|nr:CpsD/CapB family tyrosine-protein kinase [Verrucomicrobiae bacterium]
SPESVTILEPASPALADQQKPFSHFLSAGLIALTVSLALLLFLDHVDDRIKSFTELEEWFSEAVLAQVPLQPTARHRAEVCLLEPNDARHAFVEACRSLRSSVLFHEPNGPQPRTLLFTSSIPGEGKSLISANFAITMARAKARVLLIDADLRKGVLHERFGLTPELGLTEVLSQGASWQKAVLATACPGLDLLPRGTPISTSGELFLAATTQQFLKEATANYDFLILDTAPVMAADDVTSLAPRVDGVLFVLRAEHTSARVARAALELLYRRQVSVLGLVFNAVRPTNADYYGYTLETPAQTRTPVS